MFTDLPLILSYPGLWAVVLLLIPGSSFSTLLDYFGPTSWMFYGRQTHCSLSPRLTLICPLLDTYIHTYTRRSDGVFAGGAAVPRT
jgi:hypothetical protein